MKAVDSFQIFYIYQIDIKKWQQTLLMRIMGINRRLMKSQVFMNKVDIDQKSEYLISNILDLFFSNYIDRPGLAGPLNLFACIQFIRLCQINVTANEGDGVTLDFILKILSTNSTDFNNEIVQLCKLAEEYSLNLFVCIIDQNRKNFYSLNNASEEEKQKLSRAFLVFDGRNRSFYPFYIHDNSNKQHTTFSSDDKHILELFQGFVNNYNWSGGLKKMQMLPNENITIMDQQNTEEKVSNTTINYNTSEYYI